MYFYGPFSMAMLNNQRVDPLPWGLWWTMVIVTSYFK
jgi:hypothetical protein